MGSLPKLINKLNKRFLGYTIFDIPRDKQKLFISSFPEPGDDIERSYFQFCCQRFYQGRLKFMLFNLISIPLYWGLRCILFFRQATGKKAGNGKIALLVQEPLGLSIVPDELKQYYDKIIEITNFQYFFRLSDKGIRVMREIRKRYFFEFYFSLKIMLKMIYYDNLIAEYSPEAIISTSESSFTSSALTYYCQQCGLQHINAMHGEKFYYIGDSFFHFSQSYVWSEFHRDLLISLRAESTQFAISTPESLHFTSKDIEVVYDLKYYLTNETPEEMKIISDVMKKLQKCKNWKVAVRPHPRYTPPQYLSTFLAGLETEPASVPIEVSLLQTKAAASLISTVLTQAHYNNIKIVFDDISNPQKFKQFKDLQSVLFSAEYSLFSEILQDCREI